MVERRQVISGSPVRVMKTDDVGEIRQSTGGGVSDGRVKTGNRFLKERACRVSGRH